MYSKVFVFKNNKVAIFKATTSIIRIVINHFLSELPFWRFSIGNCSERRNDLILQLNKTLVIITTVVPMLMVRNVCSFAKYRSSKAKTECH